MKRTVTDWFQIIQRDHDDMKLAKEIFASLSGQDREDLAQLISVITAIRLDQMAKENS